MVSVIITTFGGSQKLIRAINSVLAQTYKDFEIIVVDDNEPGSRGRVLTEAIMKNYEMSTNIIYVRHERNKNGAAARNTGLLYAKGEYISFLDDDDYYTEQRLYRLVGEIIRNPGMGGICTDCIMMNLRNISGIRSYEGVREITKEMLLIDQNALGTGSNIFLCRNVIEDIGRFDETFDRFQDVEFMIRVCRKYRITILPEPLVVKDVYRGKNGRKQNYRKVRESFKHFVNVFRQDIENLSQNEQELFWIDRLSNLLRLAVNGMNYNDISLAISELERKRELSLKERLLKKHFFWVSRLLILKFKIIDSDAIFIQYLLGLYKKLKCAKQCNEYFSSKKIEKDFFSSSYDSYDVRT